MTIRRLILTGIACLGLGACQLGTAETPPNLNRFVGGDVIGKNAITNACAVHRRDGLYYTAPCPGRRRDNLWFGR